MRQVSGGAGGRGGTSGSRAPGFGGTPVGSGGQHRPGSRDGAAAARPGRGQRGSRRSSRTAVERGGAAGSPGGGGAGHRRECRRRRQRRPPRSRHHQRPFLARHRGHANLFAGRRRVAGRRHVLLVRRQVRRRGHLRGQPQAGAETRRHGRSVAVTIYSSSEPRRLEAARGKRHRLRQHGDEAHRVDGHWFGRLGVVYQRGDQEVRAGWYQGGGGTQQYFATSDTPNGAVRSSTTSRTNLPGISSNGSTWRPDHVPGRRRPGVHRSARAARRTERTRYVVSAAARRTFWRLGRAPCSSTRAATRRRNCCLKYDGTLLFCSSDLHGWNASQAYCVSATNISGTVLGGGRDGGNTPPDFSHVTQTGSSSAVKGTSAEHHHLRRRPLERLRGQRPRLQPVDAADVQRNDADACNRSAHWSIEPTTGTWSVRPAQQLRPQPDRSRRIAWP